MPSLCSDRFGPEQMGFATFDRRDAVPVNNSHASPSISDDLPRCPPGGVIFCATDFVPGTQTPMHRTLIMNYCVAMSGDIVLALDSGEEKAIREGDITVQQGVNHMWIDRSQSTCRVAFIMVNSEKPTTKNGEAIEETVLKA
ncbi:hypothetical protein FOVG_16035 [Fusarium oxysporum f. sp. pisi HDV247]|uniref:Cupin 2 conserved barrel domain-containing protein n=1 Tax=Fusarium oxysporum f. sp. pisi HDV247 TaxID=1080344 RepID=W9NRU1_FUSOX|nr:hypothetical protein FOVG_16035 [Fusarium oxysporum f. sp. pisi HDV247]WKT40358.1 RmlC-like jelly roll fold [Fusarium oxysporum f. sp. vasinfectum]